MASPPYNFGINVPLNTDILNQYPGQSSAFRDVLWSWFTQNAVASTGWLRPPVFATNATTPSPNPPADHVRVFYDSVLEELRIHHPDGSTTGTSVIPASETMPVGMLMPFMGTDTSAGAIGNKWLVASGQAVSRATYPEAFAAMGVTYGPGDGSTTFNLPDLDGRVPFGLDNGKNRIDPAYAPRNTLGGVLGQSMHTISIAQLPAHTHTGTTNSDGTHVHGVNMGDAGSHQHTVSGSALSAGSHRHVTNQYFQFKSIGTAGDVSDVWAGVNASGFTSFDGTHAHDVSGVAVWAGNHSHAFTMANAGSHTHAFTTAVTGSGDAHPSMQPGIGARWLIKVRP